MANSEGLETELFSDKINAWLNQANSVAVKAKRGNKSLGGNNVYADKFHDFKIKAVGAIKETRALLGVFAEPGVLKTVDDIEDEIRYFFDRKNSEKDRRELRMHIEELLKTEIEPEISLVRLAEAEFVPVEILQDTRSYIEIIVEQINKCFKAGAYDACGVMIRKLLETLIIETFEHKSIVSRITDKNDNYFLFKTLVNQLISSPEIKVSRKVKQELPGIADLLNNCAHNRYFHILRPQLFQLQLTINMAIQELSIHSGLRK